MFPWLWQVNFPLSGDLTQEIAPETTWDLPFSGPYRGDRRLERRILAEGAGYGEQLGAIMKVLAELIADATLQNTPACKDLLALQKKIEAVKAQHYTSTTDHARTALEALRQEDETAYHALLKKISSTDS